MLRPASHCYLTMNHLQAELQAPRACEEWRAWARLAAHVVHACSGCLSPAKQFVQLRLLADVEASVVTCAGRAAPMASLLALRPGN